MLVVVFDTEAKTYEGKTALYQLESEGSISVSAYAVVAKNADGTATVKKTGNDGPLGTLAGTSVGSLIGAFGGAAGLAIGAAVGLLAGIVADIHNAKTGADFIDDVTKELLPGKFALVAEIKEDLTAPVDLRMEALGGKVFRRTMSNVQNTVDKEEVEALNADLKQLQAEHAKAHADRKAKLQEKIDQLNSKIQARHEKAKERREAAEREVKAKAEALKTKAAAWKAKAAETHV
jgi:uncharacterized membrane protein